MRLAHLEGGISKLPTLAGLAFAATCSLATAYVDASETEMVGQHANVRRIWKMLCWSLFVLLTALAVMRRRHRQDEFGFLPAAIVRCVSVLALVVFSATIACVPTPGDNNSAYLLFANGSLAPGSEGGGPGGGGSTPASRMSTIGSFYYITSQNGSTDIVTDSYGKAVARFAYDPYGRVNQQLTDLDPDQNNVYYGESFYFTGQELEAETGLYDYHARIYDPETGRFLQPDPVHSENAGMDNWDRYAYVNGNPVNFTDPSGMSTNYGHMVNQIMKNTFHSFNHFTKGAMHSFNYLFPHEKTPEQKLRDRVGLVGEVLLGVGLVLLAPALLSAAAYAAVGALTTGAALALAVLGPLLQIAGSVCLILIGGCAGYVAGGLSKSSLNHIDWDEQSARKGLRTGLVMEAVAAAIVACVFACAVVGPGMGLAEASMAIGADMAGGAAIGYVAGGIGGSLGTAHPHWDNESAIGGARVGAVAGLCVAVCPIAFDYVLEPLYSWARKTALFSIGGQPLTVLGAFQIGMAFTTNDPDSLRASLIGAILNRPIGIIYSAYDMVCLQRRDRCVTPL